MIDTAQTVALPRQRRADAAEAERTASPLVEDPADPASIRPVERTEPEPIEPLMSQVLDHMTSLDMPLLWEGDQG